ncbi:hypothetical protein [Paraburkholderia fungorum]|uniref:hypothetical protein n=1 Tax=Paraburkholderia fungorum TaxID=134537 RepID=UPI0020930E06|nr:hypothetical protein [Paraburkholderia fungorum]USU19934.1 hypothetical protein NFE55_38275 [Paraburkholderia fungorum]USU28069.1 hypothetical protein NFS19_23295 [Paraburkholderia fungorum]
MSAPESSNSKAPPSLLSDKAKGADGNGSRILANLEGRVAPPTEKPRRSKTPLVLVALLVIAAGGWGAWHMQQRVQSESLASATPANAEKAAVPASAASGAPQVAAKAEAPAAASSQAATIVADDSDSNAPAASASASASGDGSRLSRALADGAEPSNASAPVASATAASAVTVQAAKHGRSATAVAGNEKREVTAHGKKESTSASNRHASAPATVAQTKKSRAAGNTSKDDSDADLLAALVARTKPADPKATDDKTATKVSASATPGNIKLAERVKECGQRGFFEDQLCRWRVCDGHWGKDPACPGAAPQARQP